MVAKAAIVAAIVLLSVACGDSTAPAAVSDSGTPESRPSSSAAEAASPTPSQAPDASLSPVAAQTAVTFLNAPLTAKRGSIATLEVKTSANTSCSIEVDYKSGPSSAAGLVTKNSDGGGNVSWTWKVGSTTTPGAWPITVTCGDGSATTHITVT